MKHEKPPYHYELPDGTISVAFDTIYEAYLAGAKATWGTEMRVGLVKVFNVDGQYVPSYEYCDDCNYDSHFCGGCGDSKTHEQYGYCDCREELAEGATA
jgi:hypothetical protein